MAILQEAAVWELEGPLITGPITSFRILGNNSDFITDNLPKSNKYISILKYFIIMSTCIIYLYRGPDPRRKVES